MMMEWVLDFDGNGGVRFNVNGGNFVFVMLRNKTSCGTREKSKEDTRGVVFEDDHECDLE